MKKLILSFLLLIIAHSFFAQNSNDTIESIGLKEIQVFASYANAKGTEPIMQSNLSSRYISTRLGNQEFPEIMKMTPSMYVTKAGGGFGDSRITLRGFGSENIALLINGIPVNGMENGSVYWSNWSGLSDIAHSVQVQRGVGISKLGVASVGGTINILTKSVETQRGGSIFYDLGNDGYQHYGFSLASGLMNGWAINLMGSRTSGDGYVNGTQFEAWNYYVNVAKKIGNNHLLSFTAFGAPQWHNRRGDRHYIEDYENYRDGIKMNTSYGYINGKITPTYGGYNEYHKPQISLNYYWTIDDRSSFSASVYASMAKGGGKKAYGPLANRIQYDFKTGRPIADPTKPMTDLAPDGLINYDPVMDINRKSDKGSQAVFAMGTNAHDWYGFLMSYDRELADGLKISVGLDGRYYKGYHYDEITDLLGGKYFIDTRLAWRDPAQQLKVGDKVSSDYLAKILWLGAFTQLQYERENIKAFLSASLTDHMHRRDDPGKYGIYARDQKLYNDSLRRTDWKSFLPFSFKAGVNYRFADYHNVYVNGGYVTRAPMIDNMYVDNVPLDDLRSEKITTVEVGYGFNLSNLSISLNGYYTRWFDKSSTRFLANRKMVIPQIDAIHKGLELEVEYRPVPRWRLAATFSMGDWRWADDAQISLLKEDNTTVNYEAYIKNLHVGNAPQTSLSFAVDWEVLKNLYLGADFNYYGRNYADFNPLERTKMDDRSDSWRMPDFCTVDANLNYRFKIGGVDTQLFGKINNILNNKYIADAVDGLAHTKESATVWYGFGTTWTTGLRVSF